MTRQRWQARYVSAAATPPEELVDHCERHALAYRRAALHLAGDTFLRAMRQVPELLFGLA